VANTSSAIKRIRSSARKRDRNILVRSAVRTTVKKANVALQSDTTNAATAVKSALSSLDRAASKGVIHRNNAARRKSRLMKKLKKATAAAKSEQ
jgi:small subunit ribosomal protein S20